MTNALWTIAFTEPGHDGTEPAVAAVGACDREDAVRRAYDVLGADVTIVWAEAHAAHRVRAHAA